MLEEYDIDELNPRPNPYAKELKKFDLPEADRYYMEFRGANSSADLYINGKKNREFSYAANDYFAQSSPITIGSEYADIDLYGIRMYDMALTS